METNGWSDCARARYMTQGVRVVWIEDGRRRHGTVEVEAEPGSCMVGVQPDDGEEGVTISVHIGELARLSRAEDLGLDDADCGDVPSDMDLLARELHVQRTAGRSRVTWHRDYE